MGIRNVVRLWVDTETQIIVRLWTTEEYNTCDPHMRLYENHYRFRCHDCGCLDVPTTQEIANEECRKHHYRTGHRCSVHHERCEFVCYEEREVFYKKFGLWVPEYKQYYDQYELFELGKTKGSLCE